MSSDQTLLSLHQLESSYAEDNLLAAEDWENFGHPQWNSVYADCLTENFDTQVSYSESTASSPDCHSLDGSDAWLSDVNIQGPVVIKEEPLSPHPCLSPPAGQEYEIEHCSGSPVRSTTRFAGKQEDPMELVTKIPDISTMSDPTSYLRTPPPSEKIPETPMSLPCTVGQSTSPGTMNKVPPVTTSKVSVLSIPTKGLIGLQGFKTGASLVKLENGRFLLSPGTVASTVQTSQNLNPGFSTNNIMSPQNTPPLPVTCQSGTVQTTQVVTPTSTETDMKLWKRQQRMIKNRESASLSRKKKKEYLQSLEEKINELFSMNNQLSVENDTLKKRVQALESENTALKQKRNPVIMSTGKRITSLLMIVGFLGVNIGRSWSPGSVTLNAPLRPVITHQTRTLLQYDENKLESSDFGYRNIAYDGNSVYQKDEDHMGSRLDRFRFHDLSLDKLQPAVQEDLKQFASRDTKGLDITDCLTDFNKTEANRINEALELLLERGAKAKLKMKRKIAKKRQKRKQRATDIPQSQQNVKTNDNCTDSTISSSNFTKLQYNKSSKAKIGNRNQIQLFPNILRTLDALQKSIQRQADTFYIISVKADHLFLPATRLNDTKRPKVSFVLPTSFSNDSSSLKRRQEQFSLMQIDCQVMDTKLLNLTKGDLPPFFFDRAKGLR